MRLSVHGSAGVLLNEKLTGAHPRPLCRPPYEIIPGPPWVGAGGDACCLLLQDIGVTRQAFQHDPRAQLSPASQPPVAVTLNKPLDFERGGQFSARNSLPCGD
jgi:hypothetical protein